MIDPFASGGTRKYARNTQGIAPEQSLPNLRSQAFDKYMQMQGVQPPGPMPTNPMSLKGQADVTNAFVDNKTEDDEYNNVMDQYGDYRGLKEQHGTRHDPNAYFGTLSPDDDNSDQDFDDQVVRDNMQKPEYVDSKGQPSPNKEYTDEDMLNLVGKQIDGGMQLSNNVGEAQQQIIKDPSEQNIKNFIDMHGEENLPEDLQNPDPDDPG